MNPPDAANSAHIPVWSTLSKTELIKQLQSLPCTLSSSPCACPVKRLTADLEIHQSELENQNQELRDAQQRIEAARDRYSQLYDFAPVGYVTLDLHGLVHEINLTGAAMLGCKRAGMLHKPFLKWLHTDSQARFFQHLRHACETGQRVVNDLVLLDNRRAAHHVNMVSQAVTDGPLAWKACHTALVDISELKRKQDELTLSQQKLRDLSAHLDRIREHERRRLAREIHDQLGQQLASLRLQAATLDAGMEPSQSGHAISTESLLKQIDATIESVRSIAADLRPAVLDLGLAAAIEWLVQDTARRNRIDCVISINHAEISLNDERVTAIFRIVQESLTNIIRHAQASRIKVAMGQLDRCLRILIADNGIGMPDPAQIKPGSMGIEGMRERIHLLDGELNIHSQPGQGTQIDIAIPLKDRRENTCIRP